MLVSIEETMFIGGDQHHYTQTTLQFTYNQLPSEHARKCVEDNWARFIPKLRDGWKRVSLECRNTNGHLDFTSMVCEIIDMELSANTPVTPDEPTESFTCG